MKITPISDPLPGEHVVGIDPAMKLELDRGAPRRLNFFTGRAISDVAFSSEQASRARRLAATGRLLAPGVVRGLEVTVEPGSAPEGSSEVQDYYHITAGLALTASGDVVHLPRAQRIAIQSVPVADGSTFGEKAGSDPDFPAAGVLVLRPVVVEIRGEFDPKDSCEVDPDNYAFEDWQLVDGCRALYVPWPVASFALPDRVEPHPLWRNHLAAAVFEAEQTQAAGQRLPWETVGIAIALIAFDQTWRPLFADRSAVVRAGGMPRRLGSTMLRGDERLYQARVEQLAEQIVESQRAGIATKDMAGHFSYLPPVGLLPSDAIVLRHRAQDIAITGSPDGGHFALSVPGETSDAIAFNATADDVQQALNTLKNLPAVTASGGPLPGSLVRLEFAGAVDRAIAINADSSTLTGGNAPRVAVRSTSADRPPPVRQFFPDRFQIDIFPVPAEQLEMIARRCASLQPLYTRRPDRVRVLVPVPQAVYEPELLKIERVAPEFYDTLDEYIERRAQWLKRHQVVRDIAGSLIKAIRGKRPSPVPDPEALEDNEAMAGTIEPAEDSFGTYMPKSLTDFEGGSERREEHSYPKVTAMDELEKELNKNSPLAEDEVGQLNELGLLRFIDYLEDKVRRADDKVDLGFARFMTDNYRIRQLMLGEDQATRLATSPVFADIAKGTSAAATKADIAQTLQKLKIEPLGAFAVQRSADPGSADARGAAGSRTASVATHAVFTLAPELLSEFAAAPPAKPASPLTDVQAVRQQAASNAKLHQAQAMIYGQNYLVGRPELFRTSTIAERLKARPAVEAKDAAVADFYEAVRSLLELDLAADDLPVSGLPAYQPDGHFADPGNPVTETREIPKPPPGMIFKERDPTLLSKLREPAGGHRRLADKILQYPDPPDGAEASFFSVAIDILEHTVAFYRRAEGRVQAYRVAIARCREALDKIDEHFAAADRRLKVIADELAEARHDVAVARALLAEEETRVDGINQRRDRVLATQVEYLAYCRPRLAGLTRAVPVRGVDPGLVEAPLPACLARPVEVPEQLREMADLFRQAPVQWFPGIAAQLEKLDRPEVLQDTLRLAKSRAAAPLPASLALPAPPSTSRLGKAIGNVLQGQRRAIADLRSAVAQFDLASLGNLSWLGVRDRARQSVSLGDLVDAPHGRSDLARQVTQLLDHLAHVGTCLYSLFGDQLPATRLLWAERLSQFDDPVNLRDLASLPRWGDVRFPDRQRIQALVDFLYAQVEPRQSQAVATISDLVRVCILLASHAPVNRILAGYVIEPAPVREGGRVKLQAGANVRIGMPVLMYQVDRVVARGVVEDLSAGRASARIVQALDATARLDPGARVQFAAREA